MKKKPNARHYAKVVEWSDEDDCFVGSAPPLIGRCCHGESESKVMKQLSVIIEEVLAIHETDGTTPPQGTAGKEYSGKFLLRVRPEVHQSLMIKAANSRQSLNSYTAQLVEKGLDG